MDLKKTARNLLEAFKGETYVFGLGCLDAVGAKTAPLGRRALLVANPSAWMKPTVETVKSSLAAAAVEIVAVTAGSRPNSPREDTYRIQDAVEAAAPEVIVAVGGGSTLDATKAAATLARLTPGVHDIDPWFGAGKVTQALAGDSITPIVAVQTAASSASHLTKYSNITDVAVGQKKLFADPAVIPPAAVFDYAVTASASRDLTIDGALDGVSHSLEVYYGAKGDILEKVEPIALTGIELCVTGVAAAVDDPGNLDARETLGLGTDLGGYSIMVGGTNGGHLTSFSLVDVTTHGRATAVVNPYYTVLFAEAIGRQLRHLADIYSHAGFLKNDASSLSGRDLALAVATAMQAQLESLGVPKSLSEYPAFSPAHIDRACNAAKDPALEMKMKGMPVPMTADMVDPYMRSVLEAAAAGDLEKVVTLKV